MLPFRGGGTGVDGRRMSVKDMYDSVLRREEPISDSRGDLEGREQLGRRDVRLRGTGGLGASRDI